MNTKFQTPIDKLYDLVLVEREYIHAFKDILLDFDTKHQELQTTLEKELFGEQHNIN